MGADASMQDHPREGLRLRSGDVLYEKSCVQSLASDLVSQVGPNNPTYHRGKAWNSDAFFGPNSGFGFIFSATQPSCLDFWVGNRLAELVVLRKFMLNPNSWVWALASAQPLGLHQQ